MNSSKITLLLTKKNILITILLLILILSIITLTYLYKNPKIPVLCYHNIATQNEKENYPEESDWTITTDNFKEHLDYLKNNNYKTLTMDEFYNWKIGNLNLPYKSVLITFDDGFLSNYEYAFKLLKEYNMNATVFVVGSFIDNSTTNEWNGNIKTYMTKDILENLKNEYPNIEIYSHSYNLHYQGAINQNKDVLMQDIENFNNFYPNTDILCYPFGQYNDNIEDCLKESNYKMAFRYGPNKKDYKKASRNDNIYEIPRLNVSHGMSVFKFALRLFMYN
jgi:peptidoglycan/xylan/chitin deacetylase (PgdA/CDA1 family)